MSKIVVTKYQTVYDFLVEKEIIPEGTEMVSYINPKYAEGKEIYGMVPMSIAALAESYTEVKIAFNNKANPEDLSVQELERLIKYVTTFTVKKVNTIYAGAKNGPNSRPPNRKK